MEFINANNFIFKEFNSFFCLLEVFNKFECVFKFISFSYFNFSCSMEGNYELKLVCICMKML